MWDIRSVDLPTEDAKEPIHSILRQHNAELNPDFWQKLDQPEGEPKPLCLVVANSEGTITGGLIAETHFSWLKIHILAVCEDQRGRGIGSELMKQAEVEAIDRGCKYSFLDCMDYHAPGFYKKLGYRIAGTVDDWDSHGHKKHFFQKSLSLESPNASTCVRARS